MKFVRTEDLKAGMRLAKPIYNKNGVLLYERNSALTAPGIVSIRNISDLIRRLYSRTGRAASTAFP